MSTFVSNWPSGPTITIPVPNNPTSVVNGNGIIFTTVVPGGTTNTITVPPPVDPVQIVLDLDLPKEKKKDYDGCACKKCGEFYPYAKSNQEDGTLICYACRHGF
jgi:hypothetical protein